MTYPSVIPSEVEESLTISETEISRDVSTSLDMTKLLRFEQLDKRLPPSIVIPSGAKRSREWSDWGNRDMDGQAERPSERRERVKSLIARIIAPLKPQ
jgi:hypothetical protein